jgi:predicted GIY-YIG superfamily endonuclease
MFTVYLITNKVNGKRYVGVTHNPLDYRWYIHQRDATIREWSQRVGMKRRTLQARIKYGWTVESALTTPVQGGVPLP